MASSSSSVLAAAPSLGYPVTEKLTRNNHTLWKAQVLSTLKGAQVAQFLSSATPIPPKTVAKNAEKPDEQVHRGDVCIPISRPSHQYSDGLGQRAEGLLFHCGVLHQDEDPSIADDMASAGKWLDDEEVASYILSSLDIEYNPVVSAFAARTEPITLGELFTQLSAFEQR